MLKERRREQVFHSAKEVFAKKGFHKASISDIIQGAGIARGTFYLYFKNKRHIFTCLLEFLLQELDRRIESITLGEGNPPPLEQLRANLTRVITFSLEEPRLIQILFHHAVGWDKELDRTLHHFYERVTDRIEWALKLGIEMGLVRPCEIRIVAYGVLGGMKEVMGQLASKRISALDIKAVVDGLLEFGLRGVLVEPFEACPEPVERG
ncbi:MAG: TetR/AcrR family transcriptional regulator [candidate division NC10 bacterium]|nr:TetR/AcrR family transcriptional regulator [candidate division NC10 bacterium]